MINWQLSKQGIRLPVSPDRTAGSSVEVIRWQITSLKWFQAQVYFFQWFISNMLCLCDYGPTPLGFWFQSDLGRQNSASFFKSTGREDLFLPWSRVGHTLYPIQFLCSVVSSMRKIYAASWQLFTMSAEDDRVLCQLVIFFTVFFLWMYTMKYSCYQESSDIHSWFVYGVFGWEMHRLSKFSNSISDGIVFVFHLA